MPLTIQNIYISLSNLQCSAQTNVIKLHPNEYTQALRYYPSAVNSDRCVGSCNSHKVCVPDKMEHLNLNVSDIITWINKF